MKKSKKLNKYILYFISLGFFLIMIPITPVAADADFDIYDTGLAPPDHNPTFTIPCAWQTVESLSGNTYRFKIRASSSSFYSQLTLVIRDPLTGTTETYETTKYSTYGNYYFDYSCYCWRRTEYYQYNYVDIELEEFGYYEYYYKKFEWTTEDLWIIHFGPSTYDTGLAPPDHNPTFTIPCAWQTVESLSGNTYRFKIKASSSSFYSQLTLVIRDPLTGTTETYETTKYSTYGNYYFDYSCYCWRRTEYYQYNYVDIELEEFGYYEYYYKKFEWTTEDLWMIYFGPSTLIGSSDRYFLDLGHQPSKIGFQIETTYDFTPTPSINYKLVNGLGLYDDVSIHLYVDDQLIDSRSTSLYQIGDSIEVEVETDLLRQDGTHRIDIQIDNYFHINENFKLEFLEVENIGFLQDDDELGWGIDQINAEIVWGGFNGATYVAKNINGLGVKVLVIDTGIDYLHHDLDDNYNSDDSYDYHDDDPDPYQTANSHGTQCSGIIAMEDNEEGYIGVAPLAKISMAKIKNDYGGENYDVNYTEIMINILEDAIINEIDVISMSFSLNGLTDSEKLILKNAFEDAYNNGIVLLASAGNYWIDSNNPDFEPESHELVFPASIQEFIIPVGAVDMTLNLAQNWMSYSENYWYRGGSCYGYDQNKEQGIVAPGTQIPSTSINQGYEFGDGTSFACPMVAGVCALILSTNPYMHPCEVRWCLYNSTIDRGDPGWDSIYGWGLVDAEVAVNYALNHFPL